VSYVHTLARAKHIPIVDATTPVIIGVTAADIRKARTANSKCCAFARAAKHKPGVVAAYFFRSIAFLEYLDRIVRYALPRDAQNEIIAFDRSGIMATGEYQLNPIPKSQGLRAMAEYNARAYKAKAKANAKRRTAAARPSSARPLFEHVGNVRTPPATASEGPPQRAPRSTPKYVRGLAEPER